MNSAGDAAKALPPGHGRGFAFARYKNLGAYAAVAMEVAVDHESGAVRVVRAHVAVDSGQAVSPERIRNQIAGGLLQSSSWTLYEAVGFQPGGITSGIGAATRSCASRPCPNRSRCM